MDNAAQSQSIDIKSLIVTLRGTQALLDSDVAMLYGYETKNINLAVSRNKSRFPENFRFQLTKEEVEVVANMRLQSATASLPESLRLQSETLETGRGKHRKYRPYAFSEQGIAMLSGILRNEIAVQVSTGIMNAFVEMRKVISAYGSTFERLTNVEYKLLEHDKRFDELFNLIQLPELPRQGIFFKGQVYDAFGLIIDVFKSAKKSITIIDNYVDASILKMLTEKAAGVRVTIISGKPIEVDELHISKFNEQYPTVETIRSRDFHDRFIIVDSTEVYHLGASLKDLGKQCFAIAVIEESDSLMEKVKQLNSAK